MTVSPNCALTFTPSQLTITEPPPPTQTSTAQQETVVAAVAQTQARELLVMRPMGSTLTQGSQTLAPPTVEPVVQSSGGHSDSTSLGAESQRDERRRSNRRRAGADG
jgi:hypothetical protein